MKFLIPFFLLCLLLPLPAKRVALVIGNGIYDASRPINKKPNLKNTHADSILISNTFRKLGFEVIHLKDATQLVTNVALQSLRQKGQNASLGVVYYAGHGMEVGGTNYLCPVGAQLSTRQDPQRYHVSLDNVLKAMSDARIEAKMVVLDCCRNDPFNPTASREITLDNKPATTATRTGGMGIVDKIPQSTLIMFAAGPGQTASDGAGVNSPFTEIFARVIQEPGISCFDAFFRVSDHVKRQTKSKQQPWVKFDGAADAFRKYSFQGVTPAMNDSIAGVLSASQQNQETMKEEVNLLAQKTNAALASGATPVAANNFTQVGLLLRKQASTEISVFLRSWVSNQESNSALAWMSDFAPNPKYTYWKGEGGAPAIFLRQDRQQLIDKYPVRTYDVIGDATAEFFNSYREAIVVISYHYQYQGKKTTKGNSINTLRLKKTGANWKIVESLETVRRNAIMPGSVKPTVNSINTVTLAGFGNQWIKHNRSNSVDDWVSDFATLVNYCYKKDGAANHTYLKKDRQELIKKFPKRTYQLEKLSLVSNTQNGAVADLIYRYDYGRVKGRSSLRLGLMLFNGKILITKYDETILK